MDKPFEPLIHASLSGSQPQPEEIVELSNRVAYNQSRGYILGVEVECGDFSLSILMSRLPHLTQKSGAGLWMVPFKGIPAENVSVPLDLLYLDADHKVIEAVEYFPNFRVSPSTPAAASVLALPVHSILSSHTQPGDRIAFGLAEEIEHELADLFDVKATEAAQDKREEAAANGSADARIDIDEEQAKEESAAPQPVAETAEAPEEKKETRKQKSWLQRWLSPDPPDPRKTPREAVPGLAAYFWTGGCPQAHDVRNISPSGIYVVTDERWYPGTLVQVTLKKTAPGKKQPESSISLLARANRWGNDGVGLSFVIRDNRKPRGKQVEEADGIDEDVLHQFLERVGLTNGKLPE
jgi:hypothetical protein